jgi:hypothetical protein
MARAVDVRRRSLIAIPAILTLGATVLRLAGEINRWSVRFFAGVITAIAKAHLSPVGPPTGVDRDQHEGDDGDARRQAVRKIHPRQVAVDGRYDSVWRPVRLVGRADRAPAKLRPER